MVKNSPVRKEIDFSKFFRTLIVIFSFCSTPEAISQVPHLTPTDISYQLKHPSVSAIFKDSQGVLWVGTQAGLQRFIGSTEFPIPTQSHLPAMNTNGHVTDIVGSGDGTVYAATLDGRVMRWNKRESSLTHHKFTDIDRKITQIEHIQGHIAVLTDSSVEMVTLPLEPDIPISTKSILKADTSQRPTVIKKTHAGTLLVGTTAGLTEFDIRTVSELRRISLPKEVGALTAISDISDETLLAGTSEGTILTINFEDFTTTKTTLLPNHSSAMVRSISRVSGQIVIGTDTGLYIAKQELEDHTSFTNLSSKLKNSDITGLLTDSKHTWIGTLNGLSLLSITSIERFDELSSGVHNDVLCFSESADQSKWIGTYNGLYRKTSGSNAHQRMFSESSQLHDQRITSLLSVDNRIWVGFYKGGIQIFDTNSGNLVDLELTKDDQLSTTQMLQDRDGEIWIATYNHGLFRMGTKRISYLTSGMFPEKTITKLFANSSGDLFVGAFDRLYLKRRDSENFERISLPTKTDSTPREIYSIAELDNTDIVLGTQSGILRIRDGKPMTTQLLERSELYKDMKVYGIEIDRNGVVWLATNTGLVAIKQNGEVIRTFGIIDGLQGDDFSLGAHFSDTQGRLYFGGTKGYNRFDPSKIDFSVEEFEPVLTKIEFENRRIWLPVAGQHYPKIKLRSDDSQLSFGFQSLSPTDSKRTIYRYKLNNHDTTWTENGNNTTATYTNLPPGKYTFEVQAANSSGVWNSEGSSIDITVLPPPWRTWWAYCLYGLLALALFWVAHRIYYSFVIDRRAKSLALEMHLAEERADDDMQVQVELQQGVVQSAYEHNQSTISLVREFLEQDSSTSRVSVEKQKLRLEVLSDVDECLFFQSGEPVVDLYKLTETILERAMPGAATDSASIISINEVTRDLVDSRLAAPVALMLVELIQNAAIHAFAEDSPTKFVRVQFSRSALGDDEGDYWVLRVSDNGSGFDLPIVEAFTPSSGLDLVSRLVNKLNGSLKLENHEGATVSIRLPGSHVV